MKSRVNFLRGNHQSMKKINPPLNVSCMKYARNGKRDRIRVSGTGKQMKNRYFRRENTDLIQRTAFLPSKIQVGGGW